MHPLQPLKSLRPLLLIFTWLLARLLRGRVDGALFISLESASLGRTTLDQLAAKYARLSGVGKKGHPARLAAFLCHPSGAQSSRSPPRPGTARPPVPHHDSALSASHHHGPEERERHMTCPLVFFPGKRRPTGRLVPNLPQPLILRGRMPAINRGRPARHRHRVHMPGNGALVAQRKAAQRVAFDAGLADHVAK